MSRLMSWLLVGVMLVAPACSREAPPLTPEQARDKGDALIKQMSDTAGALTTFGYTADEVRERVRRTGEKYQDRVTRKVVIRRPDALMYTASGDNHDGAVWYSGGSVTAVLNKQKVWVRGPMPDTLDEALDFLSVEYAMQVPTADLLYSSPYDALISAETTGGWVNEEEVDGVRCDHLSYQEGGVAWELWINQQTHLPKKIALTYKDQPSGPRTEVVFRDLELSPAVTEATFTPAVPEGYTRIRMMRHASVEAPSASESQAAPPSQ
jgi:hypothetical protein